MIGQENQLQPLNAPPAALPPPPPCSHTPLSVGTSSVETYRCSPQSVITHSHEDDESSTSDEEYDMPTDADTSEKEISYTHNFHHEQRNTYSFFSTPQRGDARFLSLQTIATFQNLNDCTLETHYSTTLSTGFVHHSPPHHSSVPAFFSTSTTGTANTAVLMSDDVTNSPSAHYHPSSDDRHTVTVPENTPNNSQQHSYRLPNDSMCSKSTTLTMYTCPTSPIGSNTCIGDEDKGSDSDDEVFVEAADSEYQTDIEVWV
ncbi:PREDICTED: uncharacterized protein LOC109582698 [Amphimedon queenslandica]|uniref:Uncharacterized protein n=2 Tax=Amphimedon queenslandica TaxID=400682 RepID=A0AAN0J8U4_AMPQE|nr:PREDICTED: uncharacterized protein LOC109582698 [Amphimedon queenslandica]|eukprot:XP_019853128.1 PREDICTED: uncharacterized protein LOC109582698 [Amphimedon queenslandica]